MSSSVYRKVRVHEEGGPFTIETVQLGDPRPDELVVEIIGTRVCHADIIGWDLEFPTTLPAVFGHKGAGVVLLPARNHRGIRRTTLEPNGVVRSTIPGMFHYTYNYYPPGTVVTTWRLKGVQMLKPPRYIADSK